MNHTSSSPLLFSLFFSFLFLSFSFLFQLSSCLTITRVIYIYIHIIILEKNCRTSFQKAPFRIMCVWGAVRRASLLLFYAYGRTLVSLHTLRFKSNSHHSKWWTVMSVPWMKYLRTFVNFNVKYDNLDGYWNCKERQNSMVNPYQGWRRRYHCK